MRITIILAALTLALGCGKEQPPTPSTQIEPVSEAKTSPTQPKADPTKHERFLWEFETGSLVQSSPAIGSDGTVYVGSYDHKLYALSGKSGVKLWEFETGSVVWASPAIGSDGTVYVGEGFSAGNKIYALQTDSKGLAKSPWPMRGQNAQHTGRAPAK